MAEQNPQFQLVDSEIVYRGRAFSVRRDTVSLPGGHPVMLDVVNHSGAVILLPIDRDGSIWFVRQYRHAAGEVLLELPAGTLESGEDPYDCAAREIREEIGMAAGRLEEIGAFFLAPGYSTEYMHVFLARDLTPSPLQGDADEFLTPEVVSRSRIAELAQAGEIRDAKTLAALQLAELVLSQGI